MKTIHKYQLETIPHQTLTIAGLSRVLCVQKQVEKPTIWVEIDEDLSMDSWRLEVEMAATGGVVPSSNYEYLGTVQTGGFVWHYYYDTVLL